MAGDGNDWSSPKGTLESHWQPEKGSKARGVCLPTTALQSAGARWAVATDKGDGRHLGALRRQSAVRASPVSPLAKTMT